MKRMLILLIALTVVLVMGSMMVVHGGPGPASNTGDAIPDGSGWEDGLPARNGGDGGIGGARNAGDSVGSNAAS